MIFGICIRRAEVRMIVGLVAALVVAGPQDSDALLRVMAPVLHGPQNVEWLCNASASVKEGSLRVECGWLRGRSGCSYETMG